jgi:hypothetical protein
MSSLRRGHKKIESCARVFDVSLSPVVNGRDDLCCDKKVAG